ncbi:unnamed protein product, partial [Urochloa humidicola]
FSKLRIRQKLTARIVAEAEPSGKNGKSFKWELSIRGDFEESVVHAYVVKRNPVQ